MPSVIYSPAAQPVVSLSFFQFILVAAFVGYEPINDDGVPYPKWAENIGWCCALASLLAIPTIALIEFCRTSGQYKVNHYL